jgi:hypothetical protein
VARIARCCLQRDGILDYPPDCAASPLPYSAWGLSEIKSSGKVNQPPKIAGPILSALFTDSMPLPLESC